MATARAFILKKRGAICADINGVVYSASSSLAA